MADNNGTGNSAVTLLRRLFGTAHNLWFLGTLDDLQWDEAHWQPPGKAMPAAAHAAHVVLAEDFQLSNGLFKTKPLGLTTFAGKLGVSAPPPAGNAWEKWARSVHVDLTALTKYAQAVFANTDAQLAKLTDADLETTQDFSAVGFGVMPTADFLAYMLSHVGVHSGEISAMKGMQGHKGYPV
jgi:hypothetical protein